MASLNFTLANTSPTIRYAPYSDGDATGRWGIWFSGSGFNSEKSNGTNAFATAAAGTPYHLSRNTSGASLSVNFTGTEISVYGFSNATSAAFSIDGSSNSSLSPVSQPSGALGIPDEPLLLHTFSSLAENAPHVLSIAPQLDSDQVFAFQNVVISTKLGTSDVAIQTVAVPVHDQSWAFSTDWKFTSGANATGIGVDIMSTTSANATATLKFRAGGIAVSGVADFGGATGYTISLDGIQSRWNASTWWLVPNVTLFSNLTLDPSVDHTLVLGNTADPYDRKIILSGVTLFGDSGAQVGGLPSSTSSSNTKSGLSAGAKAGIAIGVIVGVATILGLLFLLLSTRRKRAQRRSTDHAVPQTTERSSDLHPLSGAQDTRLSQQPSFPQAVPVFDRYNHQRTDQLPRQANSVPVENEEDESGPVTHMFDASGLRIPSSDGTTDHSSSGIQLMSSQSRSLSLSYPAGSEYSRITPNDHSRNGPQSPEAIQRAKTRVEHEGDGTPSNSLGTRRTQRRRELPPRPDEEPPSREQLNTIVEAVLRRIDPPEPQTTTSLGLHTARNGTPEPPEYRDENE